LSIVTLPRYNNPMAKIKTNRCIVCGKEIDQEEEVYRISQVVHISGQWQDKGWAGYIHKLCFTNTVAPPNMVIAELRRQSRGKDPETA
jgi:hypothetical protein